ncbi:uncharacterized protein TNCV_2955611 [Trichonephila clavipes]|nr:uncharacterized protein TNCV_2955611 [Trichonephila clavipes]
MEEKQNCIQTPVNKGTAQFVTRSRRWKVTSRLLHVEKTNTAEEKYDSYELEKEFDYEIEHRAGSRMKHVDALSRYPVMMVCNDTLTSKLKNAQEEDDNIQTLKSLLEKARIRRIFERNGILYKYLNGRELIVTPKAMQAELIKLIHENGHFSVGKPKKL